MDIAENMIPATKNPIEIRKDIPPQTKSKKENAPKANNIESNNNPESTQDIIVSQGAISAIILLALSGNLGAFSKR